MGTTAGPMQADKRKSQEGGDRVPSTAQPNPMRIFQTINAFQQTAAMKAAIELEIFTAIGEGQTTAAEIA